MQISSRRKMVITKIPLPQHLNISLKKSEKTHPKLICFYTFAFTRETTHKRYCKKVGSSAEPLHRIKFNLQKQTIKTNKNGKDKY